MSTNDITGDSLVTKASTDSYRDGWDRIFGDKRPCTCHPEDNPPVPCARKYALSECLAAAKSKLTEL